MIKIDKYLKKFSFEGWSLVSNLKKYEFAVVIPALKEFENIKLLLSSLSDCDPKYFKKTIIIFVVNTVVGTEKKIVEDNSETINLLNTILNKNTNSESLINKIVKSELNIGFVDANSGGLQLPEKDGGVGLARKIGMDLALKYFDYNSTINILACLDSDCTVDKNYITNIYEYFVHEKPSAAYVQFEHPISGSNEEQLAIICYEIFLRYYVLALEYSDSPFAIHTIGSTMICTPESYIKVQGMNKKKAAEDFYFMEKLAKHFSIGKINDTKIFPSSRGSWRVPFGTGQRVNRFLSNEQNEYLLYSLNSFKILKKWNNLFFNKSILVADEYLNKAKEININLYNFLVQNNFETSWSKILGNSKLDEQINHQKKFWFDAFKTLKLVHYLRDTVYPNENMFDVLDIIFSALNIAIVERDKNSEIPSLEIQLSYLNILREIA